MNIDEIKYSLRNLFKRKLRSSLSVLSITIGITAIFAIISFGLGIQNYVDEIAEEAGVDKLFIQAAGVGAPGTTSNFFLSRDDLNFISKINGVDESVGLYVEVGEIRFKDEIRFGFINGLEVENLDFISEVFTVKVEEGRNFKKGDVNKVILGHNYGLGDKIFTKSIKLGDKVELNSKKFEVIGFYGEIGNPGDDSNIYITGKAFESLFPKEKDKFGFVMLSANNGVEPSALADKVEDKLRKFKGQEEGKETFFVQTFEDALQTFSNVINILNNILVLIALVSLIVATVNIMNTMYTSVLERTKEIGIMKAIGARNSSILSIFIFESGILGLVGGLMGVILGYIIATMGGNVAANAGFALLKPIFPSTLVIGSLVFATSVGALSGLLPARQASKLRPVDALRYE